MKYSDFSERKSSRIILGTAYFGDGISEEDAFSVMYKYRELGGNHIDTAALYANGEAERIIGRWKKVMHDDEVIISTKGGYYDSDAHQRPRLTIDDVESDLDDSLFNLKSEHIDFYWLHKDDEDTPVSYIVDMMNLLVAKGKIRHFGASNWRWQRIKEANEYASQNGLVGFEASQLRFNPAYCLGERGGLVGMEKEDFKFYKEAGLPVFAYSSQAKGFFSKMAEVGESALSEKAKKRYLCEENIRRLGVIKELGKKYDISVASVISAAFCSFDTPVVFPIIATGKTSQLIDSMGGQNITLTSDELNQIFDFDI